MSICEYCGKKAPLFKTFHSECENKYNEGKKELYGKITLLLNENDNEKIIGLLKDLRQFADDHYIKESEINSILSSRINEKLISAICDSDRETLVAIKNKYGILGIDYRLRFQNAINAAIDKAIEKDGFISKETEDVISCAFDAFEIPIEEFKSYSNYLKCFRGIVIYDTMNGVVSSRTNFQTPFNVQKGETMIWAFEGVKYYEKKQKTKFTGSSIGGSYRLTKRFTMRASSFQTEPHSYIVTDYVGTGLLGVTQKHLYYMCADKMFRIPYNKIVAFQPYSNGLGIQRDSVSARPQLFEFQNKEDSIFANSLIQNIANIVSE